MSDPLWQPSAEQIAAANLTRFTRQLEENWGVELADYAALHRFSIEEMEKFWTSLWDFSQVVSETRGERVLVDGDRMPGARFFPDARLNFAENLLRRRDDSMAIVFRAEDKVERQLSWNDLYNSVSRMTKALRAAGVVAGDRCAGFTPNAPEALIAMLAAASIGAVWTSCSPDFGVQGVLDRFGQVEPKVLFTADGYFYNGQAHDSLARMAEVMADLPTVEHVVVFPLIDEAPDVSGVPKAARWDDFVAGHAPGEIAFESLPFSHPIYILYSSGTTGVPKCIVHSAGGTLLKHLSEQQLHCDLKPGERACYFTTCGWMMWNWLASFLASELTVLLYDGSPFHPGPEALFDFADATGMNLFGTSAKYIDAVAKSGLRPAESHDLSTVRLMTSTGSPLAPEGFDFVYEHIKRDIHLASVSGGTDLIGCFAGGVPTLPVWRGELQGPILGTATDVFDDQGNPIVGVKGELVCTKPFPSMPIGFWNDPGGERYFDAYYARYADVWHHGDFVEWTEHGGMIIHGRSDATLNPGGVRIGTAEIYRQVEQFDEVVEAICIGQAWQGDTRVVLFVILRAGLVLDDDLVDRIRKRVRQECSPRHMPAKVVQVADIPRTQSGKITELAVRDVVHGREVENLEALANPEALELYRDIEELQATS
ncbi:MAG: acetoacetate--CoA ligase [Alphaproteobacteria bacterium]|nr:acetoacetate--CoA ligase [Alphaproteobacteria bacterium]